MTPAELVGRRRIRPTGLFTFAVVLVVFLLAYGQNVWDETGTALAGGALLAIMVLNAVIAFAVIRRPDIRAANHVAAVEGDEVLVEIEVVGPRSVALGLVPVMSGTRPKPTVATGPCTGWLALPAMRRGVYRVLPLAVTTTAPFGLIGAARLLLFRSTITIAPATIEGSLPALEDLETSDAADTRGDQRSPRPYVPGDQQRGIHWPATARSGGLMVREWEPDLTGRQLAIAVDLGPAESPAGEDAARRARWYSEEALASDRALTLITMEQDLDAAGPELRVAQAKSIDALRERLALCSYGSLLANANSDLPTLLISWEGDRWIR